MTYPCDEPGPPFHGPSLRQRPGQPTVVEMRPHAKAAWRPVPGLHCETPAAAQAWIWAAVARHLQQQRTQQETQTR